jgi:hypothetical protein
LEEVGQDGSNNMAGAGKKIWGVEDVVRGANAISE